MVPVEAASSARSVYGIMKLGLWLRRGRNLWILDAVAERVGRVLSVRMSMQPAGPPTGLWLWSSLRKTCSVKCDGIVLEVVLGGEVGVVDLVIRTAGVVVRI